MYNIQKMFTSATLKLTAWYLMIVMIISLGFSGLLYITSLGEVSERFKNTETRLNETYPQFSSLDFDKFRELQVKEASEKLTTLLIYINLIILGIGGAASYLWARQTLRPIEEAHELQSRFTSDASHELRTPLAVMKTEIECILRDKTASKADYKETLTSQLEEVNRLTTLSNLLLKIARLETEELTWGSVDIVNTTRRAVQSFSIDQQKIIKVNQSSKKIILTRANSESITELIIILIDNALKYKSLNTNVEVTLKRTKGHDYCIVSNYGKGIKNEDISHIFQRFYQADKSRNKSINKGYGLGLSLAYEIVQLHHGEIFVKSVKNGKTSFIIKFS